MKRWFLLAAGIAGWMAYRGTIRRHETHPEMVTSSRGDSPNAPQDVEGFKLTSPAFAPGQPIPAMYSCESDDKSPPLYISGTPAGTQSFALIMEDPASPMPPIFDHWLVWNIPADTVEIPESRLPAGAVQGRNTLRNTYYNGPCTPNGMHYYHFKLFALDTVLDLPSGATKQQLKAAMKGHVLAKSELLGSYTANRTTQGNFAVAMLSVAAKK